MRISEIIERRLFRTIARIEFQDHANLAPLPARFTRAEALKIWGVPTMTGAHRLTGLVDAGLIERKGAWCHGWYERA